MEDYNVCDCPEFSRLVGEIENKLSSEGVSKSVQRSYDQAVRALSSARHDWLQKQIFFYEIGEVLTDLRVRGREKTLSHDETQFKDVLAKVLALAELNDYLDFSTNPSSKSSVFGLTPKDVERLNPLKNHLPAVRQILIPMVEEKLNKKCEEVYRFYCPESKDDVSSSSLLLAKSHALPGMIEETKRKIKTEEDSLIKSKRQRDKVFLAYYQELLECLSIMESMIRDLKMTRQAEMDKITAGWLEARTITFMLNMKRLQLRVMCETYTNETVKALSAIRRHLETTSKQTESELASTTHSLQFFHSIGSDFNKLVDEFTHIRAEIENKKWGLEHIINIKRADKLGDSYAQSGNLSHRSDQSTEFPLLDTVREVKDVKK